MTTIITNGVFLLVTFSNTISRGLRQTQHSNMRQQHTFSPYCDSTLNRSGRHLHTNLCTTPSLGSIRDTFSAPRVQTFVLELFGTARVYISCHWSLVFESRCELVGLLKPCSRVQGDADEYAPLRSSACSEYLLSISSAALISGIVR